ncbi:unnamed protein product [Rhizophagus irregularis]|nr:unnamed protein product [Rhizophagus irregularis]
MFEKINTLDFDGVNYTTTLPKRVDDDDPEDVIRESFSAKVLGYLDDTTWLADNLKNLQHNLNIADDFYQFASIKINKRKSVILHNRKLDERMLNLQFESEAVDVKLLPYGQGTRILGVYLSANDSNSTTIAKINSMQQTGFSFFSLFDFPLRKFTRLESLFVFFRYYNLSFSTNFKFTIKGGTYPISHYIIDPKHLYNHIKSLRTKGIFFLDQVITIDHAYLEDYNDIKKSLQNKQGRIPRWYNFLKDKLTLCSNNRLTIKLENPIIKNPRIERLRSPSTINEPVTYKGPRKWFHEKAILSIHPSHSVPTLYAEHWIHVPDTQSQLTPRSRSNILQHVIFISLILFTNADYGNVNFQLITSLIKEKPVQIQLWQCARKAFNLNTLEIYTDGSFKSSASANEFPMGYGWCVSNSFEQKIFFNGTGTLMPSATKAEILAIVTALIIAPSYSSITILTDSQAAIDGFNKSSQLRYISPRRFNKINNTILWAALHHNIQKLNLKVDLKKIRAHSDNLIMIELTYLQKKVDYWPFRLHPRYSYKNETCWYFNKIIRLREIKCSMEDDH